MTSIELTKETSLPIVIKVENQLQTDEWVKLFDAKELEAVNYGNKAGIYVATLSEHITYAQVLNTCVVRQYNMSLIRIETDLADKHVQFEANYVNSHGQGSTRPIWMFTNENGLSETNAHIRIGTAEDDAYGKLRVLMPKQQSISVFLFPSENISPIKPSAVITSETEK